MIKKKVVSEEQNHHHSSKSIVVSLANRNSSTLTATSTIKEESECEEEIHKSTTSISSTGEEKENEELSHEDLERSKKNLNKSTTETCSSKIRRGDQEFISASTTNMAEQRRSSNNKQNTPLSRSSSTPKLERAAMAARSHELIREFGPPLPAGSPSMEYSYYVIASPMVGRKISTISNNSVSGSNNNLGPGMSNRSYSFVSMSSSKDSLISSTSTSDLSSSVIQTQKRAPKSRALLQSVKEKLLAEIENINIELVKMDSEKLVLVNLRNASLLYRSMICSAERNHQGVPNAVKLRATCESIELKIQDEEHALDDDLAIPVIEEIRKDLKEILKLCTVITGNNSNNSTINIISGKSVSPNNSKSTSRSPAGGNSINNTNSSGNTKMTLVEELLGAVARLYGVVDTVLVIFYEDLRNEVVENFDGAGDVGDDNSSGSPDMVDSGVECCKEGDLSSASSTMSVSPELVVVVNDDECKEEKKNADEISQNSELKSQQNGSPPSAATVIDQAATTPASPPAMIDLSGKIENELKTLQKKLVKAKKLFARIERLSSGNPKPKSLSLCFKEINATLTRELMHELDALSNEPWCQVIKQNVVDLQQHLMADRPGERELEHIRIIVGELAGRIAIVLKSNMLE